ncbi:retrovirus-related pol polyprotein from transposon TNT 1-94 [Tanacetum coccineum]
MGEANVILGIRIKHESNGIAISQSYYIEKVLKKFNYFDCTPVSTPMDISEKLMPNNGYVVSQFEYSRVIDSLMYAMTCTRPDIAFVVGKLSRYTSNPVLEGYTDASWISNTKDNSSTSVNTSSTDGQMHNNIMAAGSKDHPPMLGPGRYSQWRSLDKEQLASYNNASECSISSTASTKMVKEVNDIRAERIAKSENLLALLAAAQPYSDTYYQAPKPQRSNATLSSTRQSASTRHKGKEVAKPITPQSESVSEEDNDPKQAQRDKELQKNLALLAKYFKKLYKPTNNNLRTSSNSRNRTEDTTPRYSTDNQSRQFRNQRTMTVAGARETVGSQVMQQTGIQCFNCKGYGHYAKECRKPKRVKDYAYHKEKMMMCKQAEQGVPLQAEQADWLEDTDEEIDEQELEAHYSYMAKIQEVSPEESSSTSQPLEQVQNHDESNVYDNVR